MWDTKGKWKIGDRIPIIGDIWVKSDNSNNWEFDLVGTFTNANGGEQDEAYINWKYFDESRAFEKGLVGQFAVKIRDPNQAEDIAKDIDALFANSPDETKTSTEEAFSRMFAEQVGDIGFIINSVLAASFFTILLCLNSFLTISIATEGLIFPQVKKSKLMTPFSGKV